MLVVQPNSRQMPKQQRIVSNKLYCDRVYAWLQANSENDGLSRYVQKDMINYSRIGLELKIARQTVSSKFKALQELGLVVYNPELRRYDLPLLQYDAAMLIEQKTLRMMTSALNEHTISTYIYFLNRYIANSQCPYEFSLTQVKEFIGITAGTRCNNHIITDIMEILHKLKLLDYEIIERKEYSIYRVIHVFNKIC